MNQFIFKLADKIYQYIFGYPMGERAQKFFENLGILTLGSIIASALSFGVMVLAGRIMGPEEYGRANLVFSLANFLIIPTSFGLNLAVMYHLNNDRYDTRTTLTTTFFILLFVTTVFSTLFYFSREFLASLMRIDVVLLLFSVGFAFFLSFSSVSQSILNGLHRYKENAVLIIISGMIFVTGVIGFLLGSETKSYVILVIPAVIRLALFIVIPVFLIKKFLVFSPSWHAFFPFIRFSAVATLALAPNFLFFDLNRVLINYFFDAKLLGIFTAYTTVTVLLATRGLGLFLNVFYPTSSGLRDTHSIFLKLSRFLPWLSLLLIFLFSLLTYVIMILFGSQYPLNIIFVLLASIATVTFISANIYSWFLASLSSPPFLFMALNSGIAVMISLVVFFIAGLHGNLYGIFLGISFAYLYQIVASHYYFLRKYAPSQ